MLILKSFTYLKYRFGWSSWVLSINCILKVHSHPYFCANLFLFLHRKVLMVRNLPALSISGIWPDSSHTVELLHRAEKTVRVRASLIQEGVKAHEKTHFLLRSTLPGRVEAILT